MSEGNTEALKEYQRKIRDGEIERPTPRTPIERANDNPNSKAMAIEAKCYDCIYDPLSEGRWRDQVDACSCEDCPLWNVRPQRKA